MAGVLESAPVAGKRSVDLQRSNSTVAGQQAANRSRPHSSRASGSKVWSGVKPRCGVVNSTRPLPSSGAFLNFEQQARISSGRRRSQGNGCR